MVMSRDFMKHFMKQRKDEGSFTPQKEPTLNVFSIKINATKRLKTCD